CALAAWLWRGLDTSPLADWLLVASGGWVQELTRPFLPAACLLALWLLACAVAGTLRYFLGRGAAVSCSLGVARLLLLATIACFLIGLAVLLSTPSLRLRTPAAGAEDGLSLASFSVSRPQQVLWASLTAFIAASLLPLVRPRELLEGWLRPSAWYQPYLF